MLEAANDAGLPTHYVRRVGLPDRFILHAERDEQLAEVGLDVDGLVASALDLARAVGLEFTDIGPAVATNGRAHREADGSTVVAATPSEK
mgnify:FL=1